MGRWIITAVVLSLFVIGMGALVIATFLRGSRPDAGVREGKS